MHAQIKCRYIVCAILLLQSLLPGFTGVVLAQPASDPSHVICTIDGLQTVLPDQSEDDSNPAIKCGFCILGATGFGAGWVPADSGIAAANTHYTHVQYAQHQEWLLSAVFNPLLAARGPPQSF